jgi:hypothetical protein
VSFLSSAFGLAIRADRPIPGLKPAAGDIETDLEIHLASRPAWLSPLAGLPRRRVHVSSGESEDGRPAVVIWSLDHGAWYHLRYSDGTEFVIDGPGRRVWGNCPEGETIENTATYMLGPVMGLVLRLRGITSLHASLVVVEGRAVAIAGLPGSGKSTIAAAFSRSGFPVMTDDVAALKVRSGRITALPGYPRLRLWPDAVSAVLGRGKTLPRLVTRSRSWPGWDKRYLDLAEDSCPFQETPLPLAGIYFLVDRAEGERTPVIEEMSGSESLAALASQVYPSFHVEKDHLARDFRFLSQVAASLPLRRVTSPRGPGTPSRIRDALLDDLQATAAATAAGACT